ncbi:MAG: bifunctional diguanylate cyclase/phosphodiesterase [Rhizobiaceae bacterium]|nr:bifunctional diguanylate cyclase/phosphodiesterase [Rhizobiaceae bacterium]
MVRVLKLNPKNLWFGYVIGFALIIILLTMSQMTSSWSNNSAKRHAQLSQIASDQTLLSQQIFLKFADYTDQNAEITTKHLSGLLRQYGDNYETIQSISKQFSFIDAWVEYNADWSPAEMCFVHEAFTKFFQKRMSELMRQSDVDVLADRLISSQSHQLKETELWFLHQANELKLENIGIKRVELTANINLASYIAAMVLLTLEAIFIFWPSHVISSRHYTRSNRQKEKMMELMQNLRNRNQEILDAYDRIGHDALHDSLTGLANRRYFKEELGRRIEKHRKSRDLIGVCHIDLDKFKRVNDSQGHKAGDTVLCYVSKILSAYKNQGDFVARIGGDEFVMISSPIASMEEMAVKAQEINAKIQRKLLIDGRPCKISASIGVDVVGAHTFIQEVDVSDFLMRADITLYEIKERGGGGYECFTKDLMITHLRSATLHLEVARGLTCREFIPYYQLQYSAATHEIVSAEALVRWRHPERGILPPSEFLETINEAGLEQQLDELMIREVLRDLKQWRLDKSCKVASVAVNLSAKTIANPNFITMITALDIPPASLSFEITETVDINQHSYQIIENVEYLKQRGFEVEIDDFGTGHASILSLQYLKPKRLKIDREFIFPIVQHEDQRQLVKNIIELSKPFNVEVVAEGVESLEHAKVLNEMGCDILQGYAFCQPIPAVGVTAIMNRNRSGESAAIEHGFHVA